MLVEAISDDAGRSYETHLMQMAQQRVDRARSGARISDDDPAASGDSRSPAAGELSPGAASSSLGHFLRTRRGRLARRAPADVPLSQAGRRLQVADGYGFQPPLP
jgi:hypothetical protein